MRGATSIISMPISFGVFQSTLLMRGATLRKDKSVPVYSKISIHAPHARSDGTVQVDYNGMNKFQSTLLMRGATGRQRRMRLPIDNFNPRSSCEERRLWWLCFWSILDISIHAPHARSDDVLRTEKGRPCDFNPRSSCEERRLILHPLNALMEISIHAPHARSDVLQDMLDSIGYISIHAPHARSDTVRLRYLSISFHFNLRSSCEERHILCTYLVSLRDISIHAPHARSDANRISRFYGIHISIHAPHARSDSPRSILPVITDISIHAPHARSDSSGEAAFFTSAVFQSTLLMRGATGSTDLMDVARFEFQSTLLMRGATASSIAKIIFFRFQSTLLMRGATISLKSQRKMEQISIHAPHARSDRASTQAGEL